MTIRRKRTKLTLGVLGLTAVAAAAATWFRKHYVGITVEGDSMLPSLPPGERLLVRRGADGMRRGRIVVVRKPDPVTGWLESSPLTDLGANDWYIKRVAAVAGEFYPPAMRVSGVVPEKHVVVVGEHPESVDSVRHGPCPVDQVLGVAVNT